MAKREDGSTLSRRRLLGSLAAGAAASPSGARRPNIVLILADDLGYGDLGCYGNDFIRTPNIDRMASEGVRFTDYAVSWPACTPSRSTILTGRHHRRNGLYDMIRNNEVNWKFQFDEQTYAVSPEMTLGLDAREITIAQALKSAGYATGIVGKWDSGRARRFLPLQRGFDFFYGFANTGIDYFTHRRYGIPSMFRGNERIQETGHATELFRREALRFVDANRDRPFFLLLAFNAPHGASTFDRSARQAPERYVEAYARGADPRRAEYAALVTQMDEGVGSLLEAIARAGQDGNTLILFSSDNGGTGKINNGPLRGRKAQLFEGGLRVPLIARWPGRIPKGRTAGGFVSSADLFPTFLAAAGAQPPSGVTLDGFNLLPLLAGESGSPRSEFFWEYRGEKAARVGKWKWVDSKEGSGLFDLEQDIGESRDLSSSRGDVLDMVRSRWAAWWREMEAAEPRGPFRDY